LHSDLFVVRTWQSSSIDLRTVVKMRIGVFVVFALGDDEVHVGMHVEADDPLIEWFGKTAWLQIEPQNGLQASQYMALVCMQDSDRSLQR